MCLISTNEGSYNAENINAGNICKGTKGLGGKSKGVSSHVNLENKSKGVNIVPRRKK